MRVLMLQTPACNEIANRDQRLDHGFIGIALVALFRNDALSFKTRRFFRVAAFIINGERNARINAALRQLAAIGHPDFKVLATVRGRRMHKACARIIGDMIAIKQRHLETIAKARQRMRANCCFQIIRRHRSNLLQRDFRRGRNRISEFQREHIFFADHRPEIALIGGDFKHAIFDLVRIRDRAIARQRPRCRRPDDDIGIGNRALKNGELHPHHIRLVIVIFDFRFRECGLFDH